MVVDRPRARSGLWMHSLDGANSMPSPGRALRPPGHRIEAGTHAGRSVGPEARGLERAAHQGKACLFLSCGTSCRCDAASTAGFANGSRSGSGASLFMALPGALSGGIGCAALDFGGSLPSDASAQFRICSAAPGSRTIDANHQSSGQNPSKLVLRPLRAAAPLPKISRNARVRPAAQARPYGNAIPRRRYQ